MSLLVLGIDGARKEYLEEAMERGMMPNMKEFVDEGFLQELESVIPPSTIPAWVSMFSGLNPDSLGFYHMTEYDGEQISFLQSPRWRGEMIWDKLDSEFVLLNLPGTSPLWPVKGMVLEGFPMVEEPSIYPEEKSHYLEDVDFESTSDKKTTEATRQAYLRNYEKRSRLFDSIEERGDVRVEVYQITDTNAHKSKDLDQLLEAYGKVDRVIGDRMEEYDDVMLVSDHGFKNVDRYFYVNRWLANHGYLEEKEGQETGGEGLRTVVRKLVSPIAGTRLRPFLKKMNDILSSSTGVDFSPGAKGPDQIDFEKSKAYAYRGGAISYCDINIPDQVEDVQEFRSTLEDSFKELEHIEEVFRSEELYQETEKMPDLILKLEDDVGGGISLFSEETFETNAFIHSRTGILGAWGNSFIERTTDQDPEIVDIAPTVAHYLGTELRSDGKKLDIFSEQFEPRSSEVEDIDF